MIRFEALGCRLGGVQILEDLSFSLESRQTLGLIGPGGVGKSVILKLICGLLRPNAGKLLLNGQDLTQISGEQLMAQRAQIGMIFQNNALFDHLNVRENIAFPLRRLGSYSEEEILRRLRRRLKQVQLPDVEELLPGELSGGMKKRICLARATIHEPSLMLCDDPTAGLDPVTTRRIFHLLKRLQAENQATAIIVSHELEYLMEICDQLLMLDQGRVLFWGPPEAVAEAPERVRQFVTGEEI